jgi:hypothetical protein
VQTRVFQGLAGPIDEPKQKSVFGFAIYPSQSLSPEKAENLQRDLISLVSSVSYHPTEVSRTTLDLRHLVVKDDSLAGKRLDVVLLVSLTFDTDKTPAKAAKITADFQGQFYNLISLHLSPYEFRIRLLTEAETQHYSKPFSIVEIVEIARRIAHHKPFSLSPFRGNSTMSKVVDMLLREEGLYYLSVLLEPHQLTQDDTESMEVYGFKSNLLPTTIAKELLEGIPGLQAQADSMFPSFRMQIRLAGDSQISQYLVNLVGSEISGQTDFFHLRFDDRSTDFKEAAAALSSFEFFSNLRNVISLHIPEVLLGLVHLFRADEVSRAFRLPMERITTSREKLYRTYQAPLTTLPTDGLLLGFGEHPSLRERLPIYITAKDRKRHMYVVGKTGTGKSMMLLGMLAEDAKSKGFCLIDPHGDLVESVFAHIPAERKDDVYLFDPSDHDYVSGLNFLEVDADTSEEEKDQIVQELLSILLRSVDYELDMFGPRAQQWTRYGCMTIMDNPAGGTLLDVPRLFTDAEFRKSTLSNVKNPMLLAWWEKEFGKESDFHKSEMMGYFTSKFEPLVSGPQVRNVTSQKKSSFRFKDIVDGEKILLVNLARGKLGPRHSAFLGGLVLSRVLTTIMQRAWQPEQDRKEFYLYIDEFQNFVTDSFEPMLSETRKYALNLIIAHQHLAQLRSMSKLGNKIESAVFGNIGTIACFRVGTDAESLAEELGPPVEKQTLRNLENRHAVLSLLVNDAPAVPFTMKTVDWKTPSPDAEARGRGIKDAARKRGFRIGSS